MKASKQRKLAKAILNNKARKHTDANRLTYMQGVVMDNQYKYDRKFWAKLNNSLQENVGK